MVIPDLSAFTGYYQARITAADERGDVRQVETVTLDGLWKAGAFPRLDFVKCDVEGSELDVVRGAQELIGRNLPGWLVEVGRATSRELFDMFDRHGYRSYVYKDHLLPVDGYRDGAFSNYFFFHPQTRIWERAKQLLL
jgi:hypothetical protein